MSTVEQHNEQLVAQKAQLQAAVQQYAVLMGVIALNHGKAKSGVVEYRLTKKQLEDFDKRINVRLLKSGGLVIELRDQEVQE